MASLKDRTLLNSKFRKPQFTKNAQVTRHEVTKHSVLICLYAPTLKIGASLVISSRWQLEDTNALKALFLDFSSKMGDGLLLAQAKLLGPKASLEKLEIFLKKSGIRVVGRRETDPEQSSQAFFYGDTGRLRFERSF